MKNELTLAQINYTDAYVRQNAKQTDRQAATVGVTTVSATFSYVGRWEIRWHKVRKRKKGETTWEYNRSIRILKTKHTNVQNLFSLFVVWSTINIK